MSRLTYNKKKTWLGKTDKDGKRKEWASLVNTPAT